MNTIHFFTNRRFWLLRALGAIPFAAVCAMVIKTGLKSPGGWFGVVGLLFFGSAVVVGLWQGLRREPRLTLDDEGVLDRSLNVGVIAWSDILDIMPYGVAGQPFVGLQLRDPSKYLERASGMGKLLARINAGSGFSFSLNLVGLQADPSYVVDLLIAGCDRRAFPPK